MRFRGYPRIGARIEASGGGGWVATEKIHGANFVCGVDHDRVWFGKRKAWLDPAAPFFGWQLVAGELAARLREVAGAIGAAQLVAYGELFGGCYPHPEVAAVAGLSAVQTGVWYAPDLRWAMFDLLVASGDDHDGELLAHREVEELAAAAGLLTPPVVGRGRLGDLERLPVTAPTRVPATLGLPPLADNLGEGLVFKVERRAPPAARPAIKRKLADFDDARFDDGGAWAPGVLSAEQLAGWADRLVNPARVASARSKVGTDRAAMVDEMVLDVAIDLETVFAASWQAAGDQVQTAIMDRIRVRAEAAIAG